MYFFCVKAKKNLQYLFLLAMIGVLEKFNPTNKNGAKK
jgi:hypothetical protein